MLQSKYTPSWPKALSDDSGPPRRNMCMTPLPLRNDLRNESKASRHRPDLQIHQNSILRLVGCGIGPLEMSCCVWHHWIKDWRDKRPGFWFPQILIWSSIMGVPIPTWLWPTKAWIQDLWGVLWCLTPGLWREIHGVQWVVRWGKRYRAKALTWPLNSPDPNPMDPFTRRAGTSPVHWVTILGWTWLWPV